MPPKRAALPTKERTLFQRLIQEYETKKYKLGLKTADTILKKFPEHGETLAMKGLLMGSTNRREDGIEVAKKGLRFDLTSFICWHALGILHRMDKNYEEALKCYTQALRIEGGNNLNLLRESAFLQLQLRNYPPLIDNRLILLRTQPHLRLNWVALAVAHHLAGSLDEAVRVLEGYTNVMRDVPEKNYEHGEMLLYHASILEEKKEYQNALDVMENHDARIVDLNGKYEAQARCLAGLGKADESEALWRQLIKTNSDNKRYFAGLLSVKGIDTNPTSDDVRTQAVEIFRELKETHPRSTAAKRLALVYAAEEEFKTQAAAYAKAALVKGVPSLFSDLKSLYADNAKQVTIEEVIESLRLEWAPKAEDKETEPPSSYLWSLYYLAQHYSLLGDSSRALAYIDAAIAHSTTMPELHMVRARVLKRSGDLAGASDAMTDARLLDGQDRFLNSKAAKYLLRLNNTVEAESVVGLFTKPDAPSPTYDLNEMQALWYLSEEASAFARAGNVAMALKRLAQLDKIFQEFWDDQLDFHSYCMRKMTLRSYVNMVRFEDGLRSHPTYFYSAISAISLYIKLHDEPNTPAFVEVKEASSETEANGVSSDEKKKAAKKARQAEAKRLKAEAEAAAKRAEALANGDGVDDDAPKPDPDPKGLTLFEQTKAKPLAEATKYIRFLQIHAADRTGTWQVTFEVAFRQKNWLLAVRALTHLQALDTHHPSLVEFTIRLKSALPDLSAAPAPLGTVIAEALATVVPADKPLTALYTEYLQTPTVSGSAPHILGAAKAAIALKNLDEAIGLLLSIPTLVPAASSKIAPRLRNTLLKTCTEAQTLLATLAPAKAQEFAQAAAHVFPHANAFKSTQQLKEEQQARDAVRKTWAKGAEEADAEANGVHEPLM